MRILKRPRPVGPLAEFVRAETVGGLALLGATIVALLWANSPASASYRALWETEIAVRFAETTVVAMDLRHWVNEALMALFFFVVGLEIKRELVDGELADRRRAALPVFAAVGGMLVPAVLYLALNAGGEGATGWGIPIATDIAFALGALALFGRGAPAALRVFLLSIAIADDVGSIVVIALFYAGEVSSLPLALAGAMLIGMAGLWRVQAPWRYVPLALLMFGTWAATLASGVHPTIAGVAVALLTPAGRVPEPSPAERLGHILHPWTSYAVIPLFALANTGLVIEAGLLAGAAGSPVTIGIVIGLVLGKLVGVSAGAYLAVRVRIGALPNGVRWDHVVAAAALAGIGYTVSLFIAGLSFTPQALQDQAKVGILAGSAISALVGWSVLRVAARRRATLPEPVRVLRTGTDA